MSSLSNITSDIHLSHPEQWSLELSLLPAAINFILHNRLQADSLIVRSIKLDTTSGDYLKAVENAVYDNPVLLEDYARVQVAVYSPHFVLLPPTVTTDDDTEALLHAAYADSEGEAMLTALPHCGLSIVSEVANGLQSFLQRTFNTPVVCHHLFPLCEHYEQLNAHATISRMFVNLNEHSMDMVVYRKGRLEIANTYNFRTVDDAVYFVLAAYEACGMDRMTDEIQLTGSRTLREQLTPVLRRYINYVMPAIYPAAALKLGHDAMQAPFDLIMLALCE